MHRASSGRTCKLGSGVIVLATALMLSFTASAERPRPLNQRGGPAETSPANAEAASSGGQTNILGDPKSNRAGTVSHNDDPNLSEGVRRGEARQLRLTDGERKLMRQFAQAHLGEIKLAALATAISGDKAIISYAVKMLEEHGVALEELQFLAQQAGVILPGGVENERAAVLHKFSLMTGKEFDQAYLSEAGIASHEKSIRLFEDGMKQIESATLKFYVANTMPLIKTHGQLAHRMQAEPEKAAAIMQSAFMAGQSASYRTHSSASSNRMNDNSGNRGQGHIAGRASGQKE